MGSKSNELLLLVSFLKSPVQYDALMNMDYLDAALNESMRLYAVFPRTERHCKKTVEISGVTIPKGTVVVIPIYVLHRDPEYWPDPDTFNPERSILLLLLLLSSTLLIYCMFMLI